LTGLASLTRLNVLTMLTDLTQLLLFTDLIVLTVWTVVTRDRVDLVYCVNRVCMIDTVESGQG